MEIITFEGIVALGEKPTLSAQKPTLSLIIPTYNERKNISELMKRLHNSFSKAAFEIIIVDDNSPDQTAKAAELLNQEYGDIKVCKRQNKLGLSSAVLCGFNQARGDILAVIDTDMQHPPE